MTSLQNMTFGTVALLAAAALPATSFSQPTATVVEMTDGLRYIPASVTVRVGDTVEWRNTGTVAHTVTADPSKANDPSHVVLPEGAETFDSGTIIGGASWSHTFDVPGRYAYFCVPHEQQGMLGEVIVEQ